MPWSAAPAEPLCDAAVAVAAVRWGLETPLTAVAEVFEELVRGMEADSEELRLAPFGDTCALVFVLFSCLGIAFEFAEIEYVTKAVRVRDEKRTRSVRAVVEDAKGILGKNFEEKNDG